MTEKFHAHFDCFSGAAGDMMLAACVDVAQQMKSADNATDECDFTPDCLDDNNNDGIVHTDRMEKALRFLSYISDSIKKGLPAISDEFEIKHQQVWRGSGSLTAIHVQVNSKYNHEAAPVPIAAYHGERDTGMTTLSSASVTTVTDGHSHNHMHDDKYSNEIQSHHSHSHNHATDNLAIVSNEVADKSNIDSLSNSYLHAHSHSHSHSHSHDHNNNNELDYNAHQHIHRKHHKTEETPKSAIKGPIRNLPEIRQMLLDAPTEHIPTWVRDKAIAVFTVLARAEAAVHGSPSIDNVHFHEVGAIDSIVDVVGTLLALHKLGVGTVSCSRLPVGEGSVWTAHGLLPVPAPATLYLMKGMSLTAGPPGITGELVTPTGAALLRTLTIDDNDHPKMKLAHSGRPPRFFLRNVGVGAGTKDFKGHPNVIRLMIGDAMEIENK